MIHVHQWVNSKKNWRFAWENAFNDSFWCSHLQILPSSFTRRVFHVAQIQVSPVNNKVDLSNFNPDKKTQSAALFWRMYKCRHELNWNAVKVTVFPQTLTLSSQTSRQTKTQGFEFWVIVAFASLKPHFPTTLFRPKLYSVFLLWIWEVELSFTPSRIPYGIFSARISVHFNSQTLKWISRLFKLT